MEIRVTRIIVARDTRTHRIRVRRVGQLRIGEVCEAGADGWQVWAGHGGAVPNAYGYPAETEAYVRVMSPDGTVVEWYGQITANKVTQSGAARLCPREVWPLFDGRCTSYARRAAAWDEARQAHAEAVAREDARS